MVTEYKHKRAIFKYPVPIADEFSLELPNGASILTVQVQREKPFIWAVVDPHAAHKVKYEFILVGTGHVHDSIDYKGRYVGTFQLDSGGIVYHLFTKCNTGIEKV